VQNELPDRECKSADVDYIKTETLTLHLICINIALFIVNAFCKKYFWKVWLKQIETSETSENISARTAFLSVTTGTLTMLALL